MSQEKHELAEKMFGEMGVADWDIVFHRRVQLGDEVAEAKANLENLKKAEKPILSMEKLKSDEKSDAARSTEAYASEAYSVWREDWGKAVYLLEFLELRLGAAETWFVDKREKSRLTRAEMGLV